MTSIKLKKSSVAGKVPVDSDLAHGELAINFQDGKLFYKDASNNTQQIGIYAKDAFDCLMLARGFNSYVHDNPNSVVRIQQKF